MTLRRQLLVLISATFLCWGMLRALNDVLVIAYQTQEPLRDFEAMLIHSSFFAAYLLLPIPASFALRRWGLKSGLVASAGVMAVGALLCGAGLRWTCWPLCLVSIFLIAAGIAILQTSASASIALLGNPSKAASRLLLAQCLTSIGSASAPLLARNGKTFLSGEYFQQLHANIVPLYFAAGAALTLCATAFIMSSPGELALTTLPERLAHRRVLQRPAVWFSMLAVFLYVGTEATVLAHLVQYLRVFASFSEKSLVLGAALSAYWILVMIGRALSALALRRIEPVTLLRISASIAGVLVIAAVLLHGTAGAVALMATGLVNASIFPMTFSVCTEGLPAPELAAASGMLMTAMCGGAVIPLLGGAFADHWGLGAVFILPVLSYIWIVFTATRCSNVHSHGTERVAKYA